MRKNRHDIAIAGGGLSGGLIALALRRARPELDVVLLEAGDSPGGNHRWSWFASDLDDQAASLLGTMRTTRWDEGYDIRFPALSRTLSSSYRSLASTDFAAALARELAPGTIRCNAQVAALSTDGVALKNGERIAARTVIDCRGFEPSRHLTGGWQVFMGRHLRTKVPHGLTRPVIMDAKVTQHGAYRFVYVLPLAHDELFVEDTYYADSPALDRRALSSRIVAYCAERGWCGELLGHETGVLPVVTGGNFAAWQETLRIPGVARAGARAGFVHPLTSYTLPQAVATARLIAREADLPGEQLAALLEGEAARHWSATGFYRMLGTMLFGAGAPDQRYRVIEHFSRLPEPAIERFYAARSTLADKARVLVGKPPVPVLGAVRALLATGAPMTERT
ncbi:MAG: lycopene beta-cyclase CrtY [Novosphingobium sp.]